MQLSNKVSGLKEGILQISFSRRVKVEISASEMFAFFQPLSSAWLCTINGLQN